MARMSSAVVETKVSQYQSHPTTGVALFGSNVSERLGLHEELPFSITLLALSTSQNKWMTDELHAATTQTAVHNAIIPRVFNSDAFK